MAGKLGVVAIGRNEGERLRRCLESVAGQADAVVYVDSASEDGSVALARELGVATVELDMSLPFSAARARNEGFERLRAVRPELAFVQFVDGDCEVVPDWLARARRELEARPDVAVVCGRRRERHPEASVYNLLCDLEWDTPVGEADACGGDALMRLEPFLAAGRYRNGLIAGEEPELCLRLRAAGWKVLRLDAEMTRHDAAMTRFGQWYKRSARAGHAYAEVSWLHRSGPLRMWDREVRSNWFWGLLVPLAILLLALTAPGLWWGEVAGWWIPLALGGLLLLGYPLLGWRIYRGRRRRGDGPGASAWYALFCVLGKGAQMTGQFRYHLNRLRARQTKLIEYKAQQKG